MSEPHNYVSNFGFLPHLDASLELFELACRGKARTEGVIQAMKDGDAILVFGRNAAQNIEHRCRDRGLNKITIIAAEIRHVFHPDQLGHLIWHALRGRFSGSIHVDHTFIFEWTKARLVGVNHDFGQLITHIAGINEEAARKAKRIPPRIEGSIP